MRRRTFLQSAAVGAFAGRCRGADTTTGEPPALIIDTHQHLWNLSRLKLPWLDFAPEVLRRTYDPADYATATRGLNVRTVYMEVDVRPEDFAAEADYVIGLAEHADPITAAVIGCRPESEQFDAYLERYRTAAAVKGMRRVLHGPTTPAGHCLSERFVRSMRQLGRHGLSFDLCMRPAELGDAARLVELCPDTKFVIDHCGNADPAAFRKVSGEGKPAEHSADAWRASIERLAKLSNTVMKISGVIARLPKGGDAGDLAPIVNHCLDSFGPDRVVFGGDWPVCLLGGELRTWISMLAEIVAGRSAEDRKKLWSANALRLYRLKNVADA